MNVLVGFFNIPGVGPDTAETPLTGEPRLEHALLFKQMCEKHPTVPAESIVRSGSTIETRSDDSRVVEYGAGAVLKNLFNTEDIDESAIPIGSVTFDNEPCDIVLRYHRGKNVMGITLKERATRVAIRFSDQIAAMRLVSELPGIVAEVLGGSAKGCALSLKERL